MKLIKKSDVKALLDNYHDNIKKYENKSRFRPMTEYTPDIITALSALDLSGTNTNEVLTPDQMHQLALALLTRSTRFKLSDETKFSGHLAKTLEDKFSEDELKQLKKANQAKTLTLDAFMAICQPTKTLDENETNTILTLTEATESIAGKMPFGQTSRHYRGL